MCVQVCVIDQSILDFTRVKVKAFLLYTNFINIHLVHLNH